MKFQLLSIPNNMLRRSLFLSSILILTAASIAKADSYATTTIDSVLNALVYETENRTLRLDKEIKVYEAEIRTLNFKVSEVASIEEKMDLLWKKETLQRQKEKSFQLYFSDVSKIRYLKGLQIIKILYEKTLALDHHFASVSTLNEINKISNPNQYDAFKNIKTMLDDKRDKKSGFNLSSILGNNIYTSVVHSFVSLFTNNDATKLEKEANLKDVECILDFTLRMHNDLNTIYFETVYLQKSNESIMTEIEQLFKDYTQPIQYSTALKVCRENDDWATIRGNLNNYLNTLNEHITSETNTVEIRTMQINLQFPIDRLLQFITQYNAFIDQGTKFYEKFGIMLNSYENEQQCAKEIPQEYTAMKKNIALTIQKFNTAYRPIEINGSKLKQLLYGINEYQ